LVVEVLEDVVSAMNEHLDWKNKITFNISSSTPPQDVFDTITQGSQTGNLDCMLCISIFYNRQGFDTERPERITPHLHLAPDYIHNISERPRQLFCYDVCLKPSDNDWHIPLIVRTSAVISGTDQISPVKADTTAHTKGKITVHIHVHHRLQDNAGITGMEDGVNRYYGCQN